MSRQESQHEMEEREPKPKAGKKAPKKARPYGIRYRYTSRFRPARGKPLEKWYESRRGRDQAFTQMGRETNLGGGRTYHLFVDLEKVER